MSSPPRDLIGFLDYYLVRKAPFQIPDSGRQAIVQAAPWVVLVLFILALSPALFFLGVRAGWGWWWGEPALVPRIRLAGVGYLVYCALLFLALPGLFNRKAYAWSLLLYATFVSAVTSVAFLGNVVGGLLGALIALYLLFQVRTLYK
jgi:hypothetical protein